MNIALGLLGILLSLVAFFQGFAIFGLSSISDGLGNAEAKEMAGAGALYLFTALIMFLGSACAFGARRVSAWMFTLSCLVFFLIAGSSELSDASVFGIICLLFGIAMHVIANKHNKKNSRKRSRRKSLSRSASKERSVFLKTI